LRADFDVFATLRFASGGGSCRAGKAPVVGVGRAGAAHRPPRLSLRGSKKKLLPLRGKRPKP